MSWIFAKPYSGRKEGAIILSLVVKLTLFSIFDGSEISMMTLQQREEELSVLKSAGAYKVVSLFKSFKLIICF